MSGKDRVQKALNHLQPDQVPIDFGATAVTGMHVSCVAALREYYGLEQRPIKVNDPYQMLGRIDDDLKAVMGIDTEGIFPPETIFGFRNDEWKTWRMPDGLEVLVSEDFNTTIDTRGNTLIYPKGDLSAPPSGLMPKDGLFFDAIVRQEALDDSALDPEDNLEEFSPVTDHDLDYFSRETQRAAKTGRAVIATFGGTAFGDIALVPAPFLKHPKGIRDIEEWYVSTLTRQDYLHKVFARQCEIALRNLEKIKFVVDEIVDAVFICGTDFGTQCSTFCSEQTFRDLYMPYYQIINTWTHKNTSWKTFKHSCGAVEPLIKAMIECGFDILNPVQCSAHGMDATFLKKEYGDKIVFWGGGVDTQSTLAFGTPGEVREQVLQRCEIFAADGGFIFNAVHNLQAKTPVANIVAMIDAVKEFNGKG
ncbi:MAG: uroporphyrinogen decarboxylase family protein [Candidatus Aminicenantaceae bacterium]